MLNQPLTFLMLFVGMSAFAQSNSPSEFRAALEPLSRDEIITLGRTQPIPVENAPGGCVVHHTVKYCRPDGRPISSVRILEQKTLGLSSVKEPRIESGCVVLDMSLGMPVSTASADRCEGGEPKISVKLQVIAR